MNAESGWLGGNTLVFIYLMNQKATPLTLEQMSETIKKLIKQYCPLICGLVDVDNLVRQKTVAGYQNKMNLLMENNPDRTFREWIHIYDCLICAGNRHEPSIEYLKFLDKKSNELYQLVSSVAPTQKKMVIDKICSVFKCNNFEENNCLSLNYANEIFACHKLIDNSLKEGYKFMCFEYKLPSGKSLDIAFSKGTEITCVEIKSIHNLIGRKYTEKQIVYRLKRIINDKAISKGLRHNLPNGYCHDSLPNMNAYMLLVLTEEFADIIPCIGTFKELNMQMRNLALPCSVVGVFQNANGYFIEFGDICCLAPMVS